MPYTHTYVPTHTHESGAFLACLSSYGPTMFVPSHFTLQKDIRGAEGRRRRQLIPVQAVVRRRRQLGLPLFALLPSLSCLGDIPREEGGVLQKRGKEALLCMYEYCSIRGFDRQVAQNSIEKGKGREATLCTTTTASSIGKAVGLTELFCSSIA